MRSTHEAVERTVRDDEEDISSVQYSIRPDHTVWVLEHIRRGDAVPRVPLQDLGGNHGLAVDLHETTGVHQLQHTAFAPCSAHGVLNRAPQAPEVILGGAFERVCIHHSSL